MADYAPGYDPSQANYISAGDQALAALGTIAVLLGMGVGAFFLTATPLVVVQAQVAATVTMYNGQRWINMPQILIDRINLVNSGEGTPEQIHALATAIMCWYAASLEYTEATVLFPLIDNIDELYNHNTILDYQHVNNFQDFQRVDPGVVTLGSTCYTIPGGDGSELYCPN